MARLAKAIIGIDGSAGRTYGGQSGAINLSQGGQFGLMSRIGYTAEDGKNYSEFISSHSYISKNVIPIVLDYPRFFDFMPEPELWISAYKNLIETIPRSIEGLQSGLTVETDEHPIGGAGEMMEEPTDVKRARSTLTFNVRERAGKSITKFLDYLIRYGLMDPDQKRPLIIRHFKDQQGLEDVQGMYTPDYYTGTAIFIEPDITTRVCIDAWLCTNMFFKSNGERTGKRDITAAGEVKDLSLESTCITMSNENVRILADKLLKELTILKTVPDTDMHLPYKNIDSNVRAVADTGFNQTQDKSTTQAMQDSGDPKQPNGQSI